MSSVITEEANTDLIDPIDRDELLLQGFAMEYPDHEPSADQFSTRMQQRATDVLTYSNFIDTTLKVEMFDEATFGTHASRDVLVTYKTLLYKAVWQAEEWRDQVDRYKSMCWLLGVGLAALGIWSLAHLPVAAFQQSQ